MSQLSPLEKEEVIFLWLNKLQISINFVSLIPLWNMFLFFCSIFPPWSWTFYCGRYMKMPDAETETNPIDRTVAHLLFHRPLELSGKHPETPESPASAKLQSERKTMGIADMQLGYKLESSKMRQSYPQEEDKSPPPLADRPESLKIDIFETSPCMNISENASNYGSADVGAAEAESSQWRSQCRTFWG